MKKQQFRTRLLILPIWILLTACGGGGGSTPTSSSINPTVNNKILKGKIVDGLIKDAKVCLDINHNNSCDSNEPSAITKEDGSFTLTLDKKYQGEYKVLSIGGIDTATSQHFDGILEAVVSVKSSDSSLSTLLSPLTTMSSKLYESQKKKDSTFTHQKAKELLASKFGFSVDEMTKNPLESKTLFATTQEIIQATKLLTKVVQKDDSNRELNQAVFDKVLTQIVKTVYAEGKLDIAKVVKNIKNTELQIESSAELELFIQNYITEVKLKVLESKEPNQLATLQNGIETYTRQAEVRIQNNENSMMSDLSGILTTLQRVNSTEVMVIANRHAVAVRSVVVEKDDTSNSYVTTKCGNRGGIAVYTGIDANGDGVLSESEQNPIPQVVCNGASGVTPVFRTEQLAVGNSKCRTGGIKFTMGSQVTYLCNGSDGRDGANGSTSNQNKDFTKLGSISGIIAVSSSQNKFISIQKVTEQSGELWLTPDAIRAAINQDLHATTASGVIPLPVIKPRKVTIKIDNSYVIPDVPSGSYSLVYINNNQGVKLDNISVSPNQNKEQDITQVATNGSVSFKVASLTGTILKGATVRLNELDRTTTTQSDGSANFENLPTGSYSITISKEGYLNKYMRFTVQSSQNTNLETIELNTKKGSLTGKVSADIAGGLANIIVYAKATDGSLYTTLTDNAGNYRFPALPIGTGYSIIAMAHDFSSSKIDNVSIEEGDNSIQKQSYTYHAKVQSSLPIAIIKSFSDKGSITGFARFSNKEGLNHAGIIVAIEGTDFEAITSRDGSFIFNNIPQGRYTLNFIGANYDTTTLYSTKVIAGATTTLLDVALNRASGRVSGQVSFERGVNHAGIKVRIKNTNYYTYTDSTGAWAMNVPIGNYDTIVYERPLFETIEEHTTMTVVENGSYIVAPQNLVQVAQKVKGKVTVSGKTDFSNVTVAITGTASITVHPLANGEFTIPSLPLGQYTVTMSYPDGLHESFVHSFTLDNTQDELDLGTVNLRSSYLNINQGAVYTNSRTVTILLGNTDASQMQLIEGGVTTTKEAFASTKTFTLSSGDGAKTVTANFYDANNNPLPSVSDSIILDTTLAVQSFTLSGASKKGDTLKLSLNLGETEASVLATIPSISENLRLLDNGTGGDSVAGDGIYERTLLIQTPTEVDVVAMANIKDRAGNTLTANSSNRLTLSTAPSIENLHIVSNVLARTMTISFTTNEPTTSKVDYGDASDSLNSTKGISSSLSTNHSVTLSNLTANTLTYFRLEVKDAAHNTSTLNGQSKLAPPAPSNLSIEAGDNEIGLVWDEVTTEGVVGYYLYRSSGDAFVKVNSQPITQRYFLDTTVENDTAYSYKLTTVDDNNNESEQSSAVTATASSSLAGPTTVNGGVIDKNTLWLSSRSPYNITANMKVKEGTTLILLPGTAVNLSGDEREVLVEGKLEGYGSKSNNVKLTVSDFVENASDNLHGGYIKGNVFLKYTNIKNLGLKDIQSLIYTTVTIDTCSATEYFSFNTMENSTVTNNSLHDCSKIFSSNNIKDSSFHNINNLYVKNFINNFIENSTIRISEIARFSTFNNTTIEVRKDTYNNLIPRIINNTIKNSSIYYFYEDILYLKFNIIENLKYFKNVSSDSTYNPKNFNISHNYWGTTDINAIISLTKYTPTQKDDQYSRTLYPIISSADLYNADFDNDGIPDYIDNDNDNDGYSDLQEDKSSDPQYGSIYNPLDADSHPNTALDNDYDGITDENDDDDDNDGLTDSEELNYQSNPMIADSDGDGVSDGDEVDRKYSPIDKNNYPYMQSISNIHLDNSNVNTDGVVYLKSSSSLIFTDITIQSGTKLLLDSKTSLTINDSIILGTKNTPIQIRGTGTGGKGLTLNNSKIYYFNIKLGLPLNLANSKVYSSDIFFKNGSINEASNITNSFIQNTTELDNHGIIINSYIIGENLDNWSTGLINSSFINSENYTYSNGVIKDSYVYLLRARGGSKIQDSIINLFNGFSTHYNNSINSDIKMQGRDINVFFNNTFIENYEGNSFYNGLGLPVDENSDGIMETIFTITNTTYTVDGITNPRSTKNFPNWVNDPSVKQYFWDPTNVGCLWDADNPDVFPEP